MIDPQDKSKIEALKKGLYSRNAPEVRKRPHGAMQEPEFEVATDWSHPEDSSKEDPVLNTKYEDHKMSFFVKLCIGSAIFFVIAIAIGAYFVLGGENLVSAENVDILVAGPVAVAGGEQLAFDVQVYNKNNLTLQLVDLTVDFPVGSANADDPTKELRRFNELMDDIKPGGMAQKNVRAILYGEEGSRKQIKITIEYRVQGSNAIFYKEKEYEITLSSAPINLNVKSFEEVNAGQEFEITVEAQSNSDQVLKNLLLRATYPFGFTFVSADTKPIYDTTLWRIGDLPPKGKKTIKIKGKIEGQDDEERVIRFTIGAESTKNNKQIGTEFMTVTKDIKVKKPFLSTQILFDGKNTPTAVGQFNSAIQVEVSWFNNLTTAVNDAEIYVDLSGTAFDKGSVNPEQGFYRSAENRIIWNKSTTRALASIGAGESGKVSFRVTPRDVRQNGSGVINPTVNVNVSVKANRVAEGNVPQSISSTATKQIRVGTETTLATQALYNSGPITNSGPIPPKAEKTTTFTVVWTVHNTSSSIANTEVRATLPQYMKWHGKVSPNGEDIDYNSNDHTIVWHAGTVSPYSGTSANRRQVAFQVALEPSVNQIGQIVPIIGDATLNAVDQFTGEVVNAESPGKDTELEDESNWVSGNGTIQR